MVRNSGQALALLAGLQAAAGDFIVTMDGDGQNDPRDIPRLLDVLAAPGTLGPALVGGVRTERKATGSKRWASRAARRSPRSIARGLVASRRSTPASSSGMILATDGRATRRRRSLTTII